MQKIFPGSSAVKNPPAMWEAWAQHLGSTPGWLRETSALWASVVAQTAKNPPAMQEIEVQSLGWEDPLEKGTATHSSILAAMWEMQVHD